MAKLLDRLNAKKQKDLKVLSNFISIFCREKHQRQTKDFFPSKDGFFYGGIAGGGLRLCADCAKLLNHSAVKLIMCPYDPKPMCKKCQTHCYAPGYRERIREVMKFSGFYLVKHGRLDLMFHYFF
ncbi:MAG: hypothetical protein A2Z15_08460 [Chloroflexi bacterium RBG_16_50_11]|nr:MAG: hypothetical protein A2Z15_08460 [Chloroflexi bacterium RBG_16_50_11]